MATLQDYEKLLGIQFSDNFREFWKEYGSNSSSIIIPNFELRVKSLNGPFGYRLPRMNNPKGWLIEVEKDIPGDRKERTFAHEIIHLALDLEGYPLVVSDKNTPTNQTFDSIAAILHSILVHPIIWLRMKKYGFPVEEHIAVKSIGQLKDLRKYSKFPSRKKSPLWEEWVLKYVLARLEWNEIHKKEIYDIFKRRFSSIGDHGEIILKRLTNIGYSLPEKLTPHKVSEAAKMIVNRLKLNHAFSFPTLQIKKISNK